MFGLKKNSIKKNKEKNTEDIFLKATTDDFSNLESIIFKKNENTKSKFDWLVRLNISLLGGLTVTSLLVSGFFYSYSQSLKEKQKEMSIAVDRLDGLFDKVSNSSSEIKSNASKSLVDLEENKKSIDSILAEINNQEKIIENLNILLNIPKLDTYKNIVKTWGDTKKHIDALLINKKELINNEQKINNIKKYNNELLLKAELLRNEIKNVNGSAQNIEFAYSFYVNTIQLLKELQYIDNNFSEEKKQIIIKRLENTNEALRIIEKTYDNKFTQITEGRKNFENILNQSVGLGKSNLEFFKNLNKEDVEVINNIRDLKNNLSAIKNVLENNVNNEFLGFSFQSITFILFSISATFLILISLSLYVRSITTLKMANVFKRNQSNEDALSELLEQITPLDNGDFTKPIFVDDKFLFNISKKIDKTRVQFGDIVRQMKSSSANILNVAGTTDQSSQELLTLSKKEYEKLSESIESINQITNSIDELAQATWMAKDESLKSHAESEKGTKLVKESINKMNEVRNTIQESSKKIKKLGESAQSITEVTRLIKDITKQINILALNAAIQAASSGESGREFTVVAQEVQRLAYDSEEATKKIEEFIKDIQEDTYMAIASMEKTTQEVVIGANLTEQTGKTLSEIRKLSESTASQIQQASSKLEEKSSEMASLTFEMQGLQEISKVAQQALDITAAQVEKLKLVSVELEETFKKYKV
jgi:twitching motility protein PilJ